MTHSVRLPDACARFLAGPGRGGPRGRLPKRFAPVSIQAYYRSASLILDKGASRLILFLTEERYYDTTVRGLEPIPRYLHRNSP
jgi:hypothetical protein